MLCLSTIDTCTCSTGSIHVYIGWCLRGPRQFLCAPSSPVQHILISPRGHTETRPTNPNIYIENTAIRPSDHKRHTPTITKLLLVFTSPNNHRYTKKLPLHPRNQNNDLTTLTTLHGRCLLPVATGKQHHNMQDRPPLDQPHSDPTWNPGSILLRRSMAQSTRLAFSTRCLWH